MTTEAEPTSPKPRLVKLIVQNFRCIGAPVEVDLLSSEITIFKAAPAHEASLQSPW